jgi:hypothetical protein
VVSPDDDPFESPDDDPFESLADASLEGPASPDVAFDASLVVVDSSFFAVDCRDAVERSFLAQPEPLKWIAGVVNAFVILPSAPHSGQNRGPWSSIPWMTSVT